jgi:large subunit ribosomal protein L21
MYAVIKTGGKQYRVQPGDVIVVEKLDGEAGSNVSFGDVLMLGGDKGITLGAPMIAGATVAATLVLRITGIEGAGEKAKWDGEASLMTKAEMNLRARGLAPRVEETEAKPARKAAAPKVAKAEAPKAEAAAEKPAAAKKAPPKKAAPKAKPASTDEA